MIKTESGDVIEARVGDIIRCSINPGLSAEVREVHYQKTLKVWLNKGVIAPYLATVSANLCTLLHRPFQIGDEYEQYQEGVCGFPDKWVESDRKFYDQYECDRLNGDWGGFPRRHKNPAWRDHSEWKDG